MTLATLTTLAAQFANDGNQTRYSGLYTQALNFAQQQFVVDTKCLWKDSSSTIVSGTSTYSLPTDFLWEKANEVSLDGLPLKPISRRELLRVYTGSRWDTVTGTPTHFIIDPDVARQQIRVFPIPQDNDAGKTLTLPYYCFPTDMSATTDTPLNSNTLLAQFHQGLSAWAAWFLMQGEDSSAGMIAKKRELMQIYNDMVSECVDTFRNTVSEPIRMRSPRTYV